MSVVGCLYDIRKRLISFFTTQLTTDYSQLTVFCTIAESCLKNLSKHMMNNHADRPITTIIFDLGNVIVAFDHFLICKKLAQYSPFSPDQIYEKVFTSGLEARFDRGLITPEDFFTTVSNELNIKIELPLFHHIWSTIFSLNTGTAQIIQKLANYKLLCLSNTNIWQFQFCLETFSVLDNFDSFILSFKVGERKPHKKIYQKAIEAAQCLPQQCLYIDDIALYVQAAKDNGLRAVQFISASQLQKELENYGVL